MKITEVISDLVTILKEHGDLEVIAFNYYSSGLLPARVGLDSWGESVLVVGSEDA